MTSAGIVNDLQALKATSRSEIQPAQRSQDRPSDGQRRFRGCSSIRNYEILGKLGEGTFGEVHRARSLSSGNVVALKKILMHNEKDGFPITALREIKLLKMLSHPNVLRLEEMAIERTKGEGRKKAVMYMVTPYMDHDLSGLLENPNVRFTEPQIKCYLLQLLEGLRYLHANKILHRDMKAANLLINNQGLLQIADFGLARPYDDAPPEPGKGGGEAKRDYTTLVVTRWYRPPELLLQLRKYTTAIDMWGVGCVFGEMFKGRPILSGSSDINQAQLIFDLVGSPNEENMPGWSSLPGLEGVQNFQPRPSSLAQVFREQGSLAISLLGELLKLDWRTRINAIDALQHPYFKTPPLPARPGDIPQFEASHELDRRKFRGQRAALPPAPAGGSVGMGKNLDWANGSVAGNSAGPPRLKAPNGSFQGQQPSDPPRSNDQAQKNVHPQQNHRMPGYSGPQNSYRTAWTREPNGLPPRPPRSNVPPLGGRGQGRIGDRFSDGMRQRPMPRGPPNGSVRPQVDTYIPSYSNREDPHRGREETSRRDDTDQHGWQFNRREHDPRDGHERRSRSPDGQRGRDRSRDSYRR
ncbi:MAG: hypothetical protein Q9167_004044 [Letrouitia subvulpina]